MGVFQEHWVLCNPKFISAKYRKRSEKGLCVADGPRAPSCQFHLRIRNDNSRDSYFLLLMLLNVKLSNSNKVFPEKYLKCSYRSQVTAVRTQRKSRFLLFECLSKGEKKNKKTMRPSSGQNVSGSPVTTPQNEIGKNMSHHLVHTLASSYKNLCARARTVHIIGA